MAARYWGPSVAGWLAGLPLVAGPILFFLAHEHGSAFASAAAASSLSAVFASVSFSLAYSHLAQRSSWATALAVALLAWGVAAITLSFLPSNALVSLLVALATLLLAPSLFPVSHNPPGKHVVGPIELVCRMVAGGALTLVVTMVSGAVGSGWSGLFAVFPVLTIVLAVFSHQWQGAAFVAALLRAMATGLYSFATFCFVLSVALPPLSISTAFLLAALAAVGVQITTKRHLTLRSTGRAPA